MLSRLHCVVLLPALALCLLHPGEAAAKKIKAHRYVGVHPIGKKHGGGLCHIEVAHVHAYAPPGKPIEYRDHDGWSFFVGDPVPYEYEGPRHRYHGAHPIHVDVVVDDPSYAQNHHVEFCYLRGPHFHGYAPPAELEFEVKGEVAWYVGPFPDEFHAAKPRYVAINAVYEPLSYERPVIEVEPPSAYVDVLLVPAAVHADVHAHPGAHADVHVHPGVHVDVEIPVPTLEIGIGGGIVGGHVHREGGHKHRKHKVKHRGHKRGFKKWKD